MTCWKKSSLNSDLSLLPVSHPDRSSQKGLGEAHQTLSGINCVNSQQINFPQTKPGSLITFVQLGEESIKGALWVKSLLSCWQNSFCGAGCATAVKEFATGLSYQPHSCCLLSSAASLWLPRGTRETLFIFNCWTAWEDCVPRSPPCLSQICKETESDQNGWAKLSFLLSLFPFALSLMLVFRFKWPEFRLLCRAAQRLSG